MSIRLIIISLNYLKDVLILTLLSRCRSTPARHAANPYREERHPNAQKKLKQFIKLLP